MATQEQYKIESLDLVVNLIKGVGFIFIIMGTLIYNKLVFKKCFDTSVEGRSLLSEEVDSSTESENEVKKTQSKWTSTSDDKNLY